MTRPHCLRGKGTGTYFIGDLLGLRTDLDEVEKKSSTPQELEPKLSTRPAHSVVTVQAELSGLQYSAVML